MKRVFLAIAMLAVMAGPSFSIQVQGDQSGQWTLARSPYIVTGDIAIPAGATLEIERGVVVKFVGKYAISVRGILLAKGSENNPIVFTSLRDRDYFAMTVPDGETPRGDDWNGIAFQGATAGGELQNVIIRYARNPLMIAGANPTLNSVQILDCYAADSEAILAPATGAASTGFERPQEGRTGESTGTETAYFGSNAAIQGRVFDKETEEALPAANVEVLAADGSGVPRGTATGPAGKFELFDVPEGKYNIRVSYIGYESYVEKEVILTSGMAKNMEIGLFYVGLQVNPITITASRRSQTIIDAPAAVSIVETEQIESRSVFTPVDHLKALPGVDMIHSGLNQANVVVRGFNNVFSGALLSLVDHRIARVPSLRYNAFHLISNTNSDIDHIEVVSGPGSALYGPNSANGVLHILTRSPFGSEGTRVSLGGGERNLGFGSFRYADSWNDRIGFKLSGQYYTGEDWKYTDPAEPDSVVVDGEKVPAKGRDYQTKNLRADARLDWRLGNGYTAIFSAGLSQATSIELSGIGALQAKNWLYSYGQVRLEHKNLFMQFYHNQSDAQDTYNLRSDAEIVDKSTLTVGQFQHGFFLGARQRFTYGADVLLTRPRTGGTINGAFEQDDDINELGAFVQSETTLSPKWNFIAALRVDENNRIADPVVSPRAALMFKPSATQSWRFTYNRAFSTPSSNSLFLEILAQQDVFGLGTLLQPAFGFAPATDVRAQGSSGTGGLHFRRSSQGPMYRSPFAPLAGLSKSQFIDLNNPAFNNIYWGVARGFITNGLKQQFAPILREQGVPDVVIDRIFASFEAEILPKAVADVNNVMRTLNPLTKEFTETKDVFDAEAMKPTITQTLELGYKNVFEDKLLASIDVYYSKNTDFIGPLLVETPNVFLDPASLGRSLLPAFADSIDSSSNAVLIGLLMQLDDPANGGNGNGTPADELTALSVQGAASIPFGTVTPEEAIDPTAIMLTYRNFGDISLWGTDISVVYYATPNLTLTANYSYVSQDLFKNVDGVTDIALNAPQHKFGAGVHYSGRSMSGDLRLRYIDGFPVNSGVYVGNVEPYAVVDLNMGYRVLRHTLLTLTVQNLFNNLHYEVVGAPKLGRLTFLKMTQEF